jgi:hypothetical protein
MWQKALKYGAVLIGAYILVDNIAGTAGLLGGGESLITSSVSTLQGRSSTAAKAA